MVGEKAIRKYWSTRIDLVKKGFDSIDEFMEEGICFACELYFKHLERAHIKPKIDGGSDDASNLHMLCRTCHKDSEFLTGDEYWEWFYQRTMIDMAASNAARTGINIWNHITMQFTRPVSLADFAITLK